MPPRAEEALAHATIAGCLRLRPGEMLTVETWSHALAWARPFALEARRLGAEPIVVVEDEGEFFRSLSSGSRRPVPQASRALPAVSDAYVYFGGPEAFPRLFGLRPEDLSAAVDRHGSRWRAVALRRPLRAVRMAIAGVTPTASERYGVDLDSWRREVVAASLVPPSRLDAGAVRRVRRLTRARQVHVAHSNGTEFRAELRAGRWTEEVGRPGRSPRQIDPVWGRVPSGLLFVPLAPRSAEGTWESNRPTYDRYAEPPVGLGARFEFSDGRLRQFSFDRGGEAFAERYRRGARGRGAPIGLTFGLNPRIDRAPEVGELAEGTVGLVLGAVDASSGRSASPVLYHSLLSEPDVELDGRPWLREGFPLRGT